MKLVLLLTNWSPRSPACSLYCSTESSVAHAGLLSDIFFSGIRRKDHVLVCTTLVAVCYAEVLEQRQQMPATLSFHWRAALPSLLLFKRDNKAKPPSSFVYPQKSPFSHFMCLDYIYIYTSVCYSFNPLTSAFSILFCIYKPETIAYLRL